MSPPSERWSWPRALSGALTLALLVALVVGVTQGVLRRHALLEQGFVYPAVEAANAAVLAVLGPALVFLVPFLAVGARLHGRGASPARVALFATAAGCLPLFALQARRLQLAAGIHRADLLEASSLALFARWTAGFLLVWLALSLFCGWWLRARVLRAGRARLVPALLLAGLVAALQLAPLAPGALVPRPPNVIVLLIDCLRADRLGCHGYERATTPALDRFARDAVRFADAISQSTYTKTSVASLFTSKNPSSHGVYRGSDHDTAERIVSDVLGEEHRTLAEILSEHGLLTGAWLDQGQLRAYMGFDQGFRVFHNKNESIERIHERFGGWRERLGRGTPFFAYLHYLDLHDPYVPEEPYATMFGEPSDLHRRVDFTVTSWGTFHREVRSGQRSIGARDLERLQASYDGLVRTIDDAIGALFERLKRTGDYDDSLIIVTSDHGDGFLEHGFLAHSAAPYEELIHVPLLVKLPRSRFAGSVVDEQVRLIDVLPSVLDVLGIPSPGGLEGRSLLPLVDPERRSERAPQPPLAVSEIAEDLCEPCVSIRGGDLKYLYFPARDRGELYDLRRDPAERHDLTAERPAEAHALRNQARAIVAAGELVETQAVPVDPQTLEELRALGYVK